MPRRKTAISGGVDERLASDRVADVALTLAGESGWYALRMRDLAAHLGVRLDQLAARYVDPNAIADLVFARARDAMLAVAPDGRQPPRRRVELAMLRWFDALAPHRRVAAQMLQAKLHPSHAHHWMPLPFHLSRLIWWLREASALDAEGPRRQAEEIALTLVFLGVLGRWCADASDGQARTRALLARLLDRTEARLRWWKPA